MNNLVPAAPTNFTQVGWAGHSVPALRVAPIHRLGAMLYRQRLWGLATFLSVLLIGIYLTYTAKREYTAVALVQLDQQVPRVLAENDLDPQPNQADADRFLQTQLDRVSSLSLAEDVAARVRIESSPALLNALGIEPATDRELLRRTLASHLQENVEATLGVRSRLAQIKFTSYDPKASALIANAYADALTAVNLDSKISTSNKAKLYLGGQLGEAKARLENSERSMLAYARAADLTTAIAPASQSGDVGSFRSQQVASMTDTMSEATARRINAEQQWGQVRNTAAMDLPEVQSNSAVQNLYAQRAQLQSELAQDRQRHTDDYPSVAETSAKIAQLDKQIGALAANIKSSFYGKYRAALLQEQQTVGSLAGLRNVAMAERQRNVGFNSLKREVETNKAFYDGLLQRYKEVAAASGAPAANVTLVDRAVAPVRPSSPNTARNTALSGMIGLILAFLVGAAREGKNQTVRMPDDVQGMLNVRALGVVPLWSRQEAREYRSKNWTLSHEEAHHSVAVAIEQATGGLPKTLLITSSSASEGKSTTAIGLANSYTAMGKRVLLIDGDLRHPTLPNTDDSGQLMPGISELLSGRADSEDAVQQTSEQGYHFVAAGRDRLNPVSILKTPQIADVLNNVCADFDITIIDGPPILGLADAVLLASAVESVLLVVEANRLHWAQVDNAISRLPTEKIIGAVVTKFNARAAGVPYGGAEYYTY